MSERTAIPRRRTINDPANVDDVLRADAGRPLDATVRASMEARFAHDFSRVRIRDDARAARSAASIGARAYTVGDDIVFARDRYSPATERGVALLAHELGHVVQQAGARRPNVLRIDDGHTSSGAAAATKLSEHVVQRQPESDPHIGPGLPSAPSQLGGFTIRLQLDSNMVPTGKASISVAGPGSIPLVGGAEIGLQRNADGTYTAVTGKGTTIVSPADVRKILAGSAIDPKKPKEIRLPGCSDLRRPGNGAFYSVAEFKQHATFTRDPVTAMYWLSLPDWLIDALVESCKPAPLVIPDRPPRPDYNDAPPPSGDTRTV